MIDLEGVEHYPAITEIVDVLCNKTQNTDRGFFQTEVAYMLCKMASNMRATILTKDRGEIPVNMYALALATSGYGKGHSMYILETELMSGFRRRFMDHTFGVITEQSLWKIANKRAAANGTDQQEEFDKAQKESNSAGYFLFSFDSGTTPAVKQLRNKLLLSEIGAINLEIDEVGSNLVANVEVLTAFLELYDQGKIKQKLTKEGKDNQRGEDLDGKTPANMLLFGTPAKLFDGGQTEDQFFEMLETGYARRCLFGIGHTEDKALYTQTPEEIYHGKTTQVNSATINKWNRFFHSIADPGMYGWEMTVEDDVGIKLVEYQMACEAEAMKMADHEEIRKAELSHRYFRALKLAGAYAFMDQSNDIEMDHLLSAILLVEESGAAFQSILKREKNYMKLARYIASTNGELTHADLNEELPFYKIGIGARNEMMTLATAWGYKQHIIIKKSFVDGIEFFSGETLEETDLDSMLVTYSSHFAYEYLCERVPFDKLHVLTQAEGMHWVNHDLKNGHRSEENVIPGFNMIVIDVDDGVSLEQVHDLLSEYQFMTYTTKRHTDEQNRFRLILPINYLVELDSDDYKEFMNSVMEWLPFPSDEAANQRSKKWESYADGSYHVNQGELLDALQFIPKTSKNEQYRESMQELQSLDNLERWFAQRIASGNRNNQMIKFALALVDGGMDLLEVSKSVHAFNEKLNKPLPKDEIESTIMVTVSKRLAQKQPA